MSNPDNDFLKDMPEGMILKAVEVSAGEVTPEELRQINKYTLSPLKEEEVFTFKAIMGDNEIDDRNFEPFNLNALKDLAKLYVGKTVIKDHFRRADNQVARIYATEVVPEAKTTGAGEAFAKLIAKSYMVRTASNTDLIAEINGGIKREVSTGFLPKRAVCSICGTDNMKTYCPHYPGKEYEIAGEKKVCMMTLDGAKEAYELSLVAVPAQPRAGTTKAYGGQKPAPPDADEAKTASGDDNEGKSPDDDTETKDAELRLRAVESFLFTQNASEMEGE